MSSNLTPRTNSLELNLENQSRGSQVDNGAGLESVPIETSSVPLGLVGSNPTPGVPNLRVPPLIMPDAAYTTCNCLCFSYPRRLLLIDRIRVGDRRLDENVRSKV